MVQTPRLPGHLADMGLDSLYLQSEELNLYTQCDSKT